MKRREKGGGGEGEESIDEGKEGKEGKRESGEEGRRLTWATLVCAQFGSLD